MGGDGTTTHHASSCTYVIVLAGEFLQLTSNLRMLVCIHHVVVPPELPAAVVTGTESGDGGWGGCGSGGGGGGGGKDVLKYKPRVSATMFLHPRRGKGALLDVGRDLRLVAVSSNSCNLPNSSSMTMTTTTGDMWRDDKQNCCIQENG